MPSRSQIATAYLEAFAADDHATILALLSEDVVWDIPGHRHLQGKAAFASEITAEGFEGGPRLVVDRIVEAGETVVAPHRGETRRTDGTTFRFAACDLFTFDGDLICRVESYVVPLP